LYRFAERTSEQRNLETQARRYGEEKSEAGEIVRPMRWRRWRRRRRDPLACWRGGVEEEGGAQLEGRARLGLDGRLDGLLGGAGFGRRGSLAVALVAVPDLHRREKE